MLELLKEGGWILVPIGLCSVVALTVFVERWLTIREQLSGSEDFIHLVRGFVAEGKFAEARARTQQSSGVLAKVLEAGLSAQEESVGFHLDSMASRGREETTRIEGPIEIIGTCSTISPLLGLLGTVVGMIDVFRNVQNQGMGNTQAFASGIWQALVTTAVGLAVAIPSYVLYKWLLSHFDNKVAQLENNVQKIVSAQMHETR